MDSRSVGNNNKIQLCAGPPQKMNAFFVTRNASNAQAQVVSGGGGEHSACPAQGRPVCPSVCCLPPPSCRGESCVITSSQTKLSLECLLITRSTTWVEFRGTIKRLILKTLLRNSLLVLGTCYGFKLHSRRVPNTTVLVDVLFTSITRIL